MQALEGIKVIDLGRALAGPFCGMLLADLGADVIKVEPPGLGDDSREWPPLVNGESTYFLSVNRNKRSIVLDLASPQGKAVLLRMAETADVLVENYRADVMDRWGLGWDVLREVNPRLVYCALTGFGRTGPRSGQPATDVYAQAFTGVMGLTREPGQAPLRVGVSLCDMTTGMFGAYGILAALQARQLTGAGQLVDTSLMEGQIAFLSYHLTSYHATGKVPQPQGKGHPSIVPYGAFECSDGWVAMATFNDRLWRRAAGGLGLQELAADPRFDTNPKRLERRTEFLPIVEARFRTRTVAEWVSIMEALDVPLAPVNDIPAICADPQVAAREMLQTMQHPTVGQMTTFGFPVKLSGTPCEVRMPPPTLGQHTQEILAEYGFAAQPAP